MFMNFCGCWIKWSPQQRHGMEFDEFCTKLEDASLFSWPVFGILTNTFLVRPGMLWFPKHCKLRLLLGHSLCWRKSQLSCCCQCVGTQLFSWFFDCVHNSVALTKGITLHYHRASYTLYPILSQKGLRPVQLNRHRLLLREVYPGLTVVAERGSELLIGPHSCQRSALGSSRRHFRVSK